MQVSVFGTLQLQVLCLWSMNKEGKDCWSPGDQLMGSYSQSGRGLCIEPKPVSRSIRYNRRRCRAGRSAFTVSRLIVVVVVVTVDFSKDTQADKRRLRERKKENIITTIIIILFWFCVSVSVCVDRFAGTPVDAFLCSAKLKEKISNFRFGTNCWLPSSRHFPLFTL